MNGKRVLSGQRDPICNGYCKLVSRQTSKCRACRERPAGQQRVVLAATIIYGNIPGACARARVCVCVLHAASPPARSLGGSAAAHTGARRPGGGPPAVVCHRTARATAQHPSAITSASARGRIGIGKSGCWSWRGLPGAKGRPHALTWLEYGPPFANSLRLATVVLVMASMASWVRKAMWGVMITLGRAPSMARS